LLHNHPHLSSGADTIGQKWPQYKELSPTTLAIKKILSVLFLGSERRKGIARLNTVISKNLLKKYTLVSV
jgi:hypothetical protein